MISIDEVVGSCIEAAGEADPREGVREALSRFVTGNPLRSRPFQESIAGLHVVYRSPELTVLHIIWPPQMTLYPHDHRMWAAIGIYTGCEDNAFYRRGKDTLVPSGGRTLEEGTVQLLGADVIHSVHNPARSSYTGAIHVYGGDFVGTPRSQWDPDSLIEQPYDLNAVRQEFDRAERASRAESTT